MKKYVLCLAVSAALLLSSCGQEASEYRTSDIEEYMNLSGHITDEGLDLDSGLLIFPDSLSDDAEYEYEYQCEYNMADSSYFILLEANYTEEMFHTESERLANLEVAIDLGGETQMNRIEYDELRFSYPAYVSIYNSNLSFEYALTDEESNKIVYIFIQQYDSTDIMEEDYLPVEFQDESNIEYSLRSFDSNMYYAMDQSGDAVYYQDRADGES